MYKFFLALGLSMVISVGSVSAAAQDKIGFVNSDRLLREAAPAQAAQQKLEAEFSKRGKELEDVAQRLKNQSDKLEKDGAVMPEAERGKRQREFADADRDFQRKRREYQEDLAQRRNEELAAVLERANRVIKQIAEQEKYDLILQDAIYFSSKIDITEKVIRVLNGTK